MRQMGIREVRDNFTATIRAVRDGEVVEVTHDGQPVALITPVRSGRIQRLVDERGLGRAARRLEPAAPLPPTATMSASEALADDRSGDR